MNFLEELAAEWYEYTGYFVRTNIKFGKRPKGGYDGEIDVAAFDPHSKEFIHIETSGDADSWEQREKRFRKKFTLAEKHYEEVFPFEKSPIRQIAIVSFTKPKICPSSWGKIEVMTVPDFVEKIISKLRNHKLIEHAVPESYPILRTIQYMTGHISVANDRRNK